MKTKNKCIKRAQTCGNEDVASDWFRYVDTYTIAGWGCAWIELVIQKVSNEIVDIFRMSSVEFD